MKKYTAIAAAVLLSCSGILSMTGCSESTDPSTTSSLTITAETDGTKATSAFQSHQDTPSGGISADSIEITRVRYLVSAVKLHVAGNDTTKDQEIKAGPFVLEFTPGLSRVVSNITIPSGSYEKIKFEIHKFSSSVDQNYLNDPTFTDFVTNERSTVVVEGRVWSANSSIPVNFVYKSAITANVESSFPGLITFDGGSTPTVAMVFSPKLAFKGTNVLDPRDAGNASDLDKYLKNAIKAWKK